MVWNKMDSAPKSISFSDVKEFLGWVPDKDSIRGGDIRVIWYEPGIGQWWGDRDLEEKPILWCPMPEQPTPEEIANA